MSCYAKPGQTIENLKHMIEDNGGVKESTLTFRQVIKSLKDFGDQYASVMPVAKDAEPSVWGINDIWYDGGILMLGQTDDEGLTCDIIAERIEECIPADLLDEVAVVKIGETYKRGEVNVDILTRYGEIANWHTIKSSMVKSCRDDNFCKWVLKFA